MAVKQIYIAGFPQNYKSILISIYIYIQQTSGMRKFQLGWMYGVFIYGMNQLINVTKNHIQLQNT